MPGRMLLAFLLLTGSVFGQEKDPWVGVKVVTRYARPLLNDGRVVDDGTRFRIYTVKKRTDDNLQVTANEVTGWISTSAVVPLDEAIDFYSGEIDDNPNNYAAYNLRGVIRKEKGDYEGAIADFGEAIRLHPTGRWPYNNRGVARNQQKEFAKAVADFDEAIRLDPDNALSYSNRGMAHSGLKEFARAMADYDEAARLDPKAPAPLNQKAWLRATCPDEHFRDGPKAIEEATRACEMTSWKRPGFIDTLAAAYAESGFFEQAARYQQEAIDGLPSGSHERKEFTARLALYKKKKPYRQPAEVETPTPNPSAHRPQ